MQYRHHQQIAGMINPAQINLADNNAMISADLRQLPIAIGNNSLDTGVENNQFRLGSKKAMAY